jgi:hypothetical protein
VEHHRRLAISEPVDLSPAQANILEDIVGQITQLRFEPVLCLRFSRAHHLSSYDRSTFRLHDTIRYYLRDLFDASDMQGLHADLVEAISSLRAGSSDTLSRRYYFGRLAHHHVQAQQIQQLAAVLLDPAWLVDKLSFQEDVGSLIADFLHLRSNEAASLISTALLLSKKAIQRDSSQVLPQVVGRLAAHENRTIIEFIARARRMLPPVVIFRQAMNYSSWRHMRIASGHLSCFPMDVWPRVRPTIRSKSGIWRMQPWSGN